MHVTRRTVLRTCTLGAMSILSGFPSRSGWSLASDIPPPPIIEQSISELGRRIAEREVSCEEVVQAFLGRIETVNERLNAVVQLQVEAALSEARRRDQELARGEYRGPLHGIPFTVKDSFDTAGIISAAGTPGRAHFRPKEDATVVARLRAAGAVLLGKTNTPELTLAYQTNNQVYGATLNPYDLRRTPGGSSGGAAAILAAGGSPMDVGSDTAGSIRVPAHFCGIAGLKPTCGRVPRTGHVISFEGPLESLTHVGPMARFVGDLRIILQAIAGVDGIDPHVVPVPLRMDGLVRPSTLRVAYFSNNGIVAPTPAVDAAVKSAVSSVQEYVERTEEVAPQTLNQAYELFTQLFTADGFDWVRRTLENAGTDHSSLLQSTPSTKSTTEYVKLIEKWDGLVSGAMEFWRNHDVLICPVSADSAGLLGEGAPLAAFSYSVAINVLGWPAVAVRSGTAPGGLPVGVQVVAPMWREDLALAVAELIERELGGWRPIQNLDNV